MNWDCSVVTVLLLATGSRFDYWEWQVADGLRKNDPAILHATVTVSKGTIQ